MCTLLPDSVAWPGLRLRDTVTGSVWKEDANRPGRRRSSTRAPVAARPHDGLGAGLAGKPLGARCGNLPLIASGIAPAVLLLLLSTTTRREVWPLVAVLAPPT